MNKKIGTIAWQDLTVNNAEDVRDFYAEVVGWKPNPVNMGDYDDFSMAPEGADQPSAGICHAKGDNKNLPPQWLIYIYVENLNTSMTAVEAKGGKLLTEVKSYGGSSKYVIIEDPAGAVCALYEDNSQ